MIPQVLRFTGIKILIIVTLHVVGRLIRVYDSTQNNEKNDMFHINLCLLFLSPCMQLVGTVVAGIVNLVVAWWMIGGVENICDVQGLHPNSPWTCPKHKVTFDQSVIWGLIGPRRLFGPGGLYRNTV